MANSEQVLKSSALRLAIILLLLVILLTATILEFYSQFSYWNQIPSIVSAFATILLVSLTAEYADSTANLVEENKLAREIE